MELIKTLFSRRWIIATIFVILGMVLMIRLGIWQLDRLEQRRAANEVLRAALASDALQLTGEPVTETPESLKDRKVTAEGAFDFENQVILLVQNWNGQAGVHLLTPYLIADTDTAVIVDRGWVPQSDVDANHLSQYDAENVTQLDGFVALSQPLSRYGDPALQPDGPQSDVYRVDVEMLQAQMPYELLPFYVLQAPSGNEAPPFREEPQIDLSEGPHLSYAIQWFLFTLILGGGYLLFVRKKMNDEAATAVEKNEESPSINSPKHSN